MKQDKQRPPIGGVLFDMDGTLVDAFGPIIYALNRTLASFGKPEMDDTAVRRHTGRGESSITTLFGDDRQEAIRRYLEFHDERLFDLAPMPGAEALLGRLKSLALPVAVVTSKSQSRAELQLAHLGWQHYFGTIIGMQDGRRQKPDPHTLEMACTELGIVPAEALMIGDGTADMQAARNAGMRAVGLTGHFTAEELQAAGAEHCFSNLGEIDAWLSATWLNEPTH
ncbi:MAG TPA: HAD family hydrolase [Mariprofundaceae bacterium]|nr:HAD family hydrolase [Mariprofundaceae bacterium]